MNKEMMKKNLSSHVLLQPPAYRLDYNGFEARAVEDDWWLVVEQSNSGSYAFLVTAKGLSWDAGPVRAAGRGLLDHTFDASEISDG